MSFKESNESLLRRIATLYVVQDGEKLKEELLKHPHTDYDFSALDKKMHRIIKAEEKKRRKKYYMVAVCLLFLIVSSQNFLVPRTIEEKTPSITDIPTTQDILLLSSRLPSNYTLLDIQQDQGKTIYTVENDTLNKIVLTVNEIPDPMDVSSFQTLDISGVPAYALIKKDYKLITFEHENLRYTLTSNYNYRDLIDLSKNIL